MRNKNGLRKQFRENIVINNAMPDEILIPIVAESIAKKKEI